MLRVGATGADLLEVWNARIDATRVPMPAANCEALRNITDTDEERVAPILADVTVGDGGERNALDHHHADAV